MVIGKSNPASNRVLFTWVCYLLVAIALWVVSDVSGRWDGKHTAGSTAWREYNCVVCHSIYGLGGHVGPDLTNAASRRVEDYISFVLREGKGQMPCLGLSEGEFVELVAYLVEIDQLGEYPIKSTSSMSFGNNH